MKPLAPLLFVILGGCAAPLTNYAGYRGEGVFTAHPAHSALCMDGYTVDLGPIALDKADRLHRSLQGLPHVESTLGIAMQARSDVPYAEPHPTALVTMTLRDDRNHIVLSLQDRLSDWTWLHSADDPLAFIYQPGRLIDVGVAPGVIHTQRFPIGEDDSWGTYFTPRRDARYTLDVSVDEPDPALAGLDARLQVRRPRPPCDVRGG